jgi:hypothetical protein
VEQLVRTPAQRQRSSQDAQAYGIRSKDVKLGGTNRKGYRREDFWDAWTRYGRSGSASEAAALTNRRRSCHNCGKPYQA